MNRYRFPVYNLLAINTNLAYKLKRKNILYGGSILSLAITIENILCVDKLFCCWNDFRLLHNCNKCIVMVGRIMKISLKNLE